MREKAARFYKYRAHSGELHEFKKQLAALKEERDRIDILAPQYAQLVAARAKFEELYDAAIRNAAKSARACAEINRLLSALPRLAALRALRETLAPLADLPTPRAGAAEDLLLLQREEIDLGARLDAAEQEIARLEEDRDGSVLDQAALASRRISSII